MAYEFAGKKYEKASTHQKEWGHPMILCLSFKILSDTRERHGVAH
jgi:hypothetical protein